MRSDRKDVLFWWIFSTILFAVFSYPKRFYTSPPPVAVLRGDEENRVNDYFCIGIRYEDNSRLGGPVENYCFGIPFKIR
jgi:hypothetical protein